MSSLQTTVNSKIKSLTYLAVTTFVVAVSYMTVNCDSVMSAGYLAGIGVALICVSFIPIWAFCSCVFFTIPFTAVLKLPFEAFSFMTLLQVLLVVRTIVSNQRIAPVTLGSLAVWAAVTQFVPLIIFDQAVSNIILLLLNLLTFYCIFKLSKDNVLNTSVMFFAFAVGVLIAGLISKSYGIAVFQYNDYRFSGLWTDPNFWGMFCLIGIITCLILGFKKPVRFIIMAPIIIGLAQQGFLTMSRTFIIVCSLMAMVIVFYYTRRSIWAGVLIFAVIAIAIVYALPYAVNIFNSRGIDYTDMTNGRFDNTMMIFDYIMSNPGTSIFGFGYCNTLNVMHANHFGHGATHNSYADLFVEFGAIFNLIFLAALYLNLNVFRKFILRLYTLPGLVICVLLFYMGTLSMLKYSLLYLTFGLYFGYCNQSLGNGSE